MTTMREEFEAAVIADPDLTVNLSFFDNEDRDYVFPEAVTLFSLWQAAYAAGQSAEREACALAAADVDEPPWTGYECPNTFGDGVSAAVAAIRNRKAQNTPHDAQDQSIP